MGKAANARRRALFAELEADGRLHVPAIVPKVRKRRTHEEKVREEQEARCCKVRYKTLPEGFRECHGCPCNG